LAFVMGDQYKRATGKISQRRNNPLETWIAGSSQPTAKERRSVWSDRPKERKGTPLLRREGKGKGKGGGLRPAPIQSYKRDRRAPCRIPLDVISHKKGWQSTSKKGSCRKRSGLAKKRIANGKRPLFSTSEDSSGRKI